MNPAENVIRAESVLLEAWKCYKKHNMKNYKIDRQLFDDLLETLEIGSLCALGGGIPLPVKNALQYFEEELKEYFK